MPQSSRPGHYCGLHQGPASSPQRVRSEVPSTSRVGFRLLRLLRRLLRLRLLIWRASDRAIVASADSLSCCAKHSV